MRKDDSLIERARIAIEGCRATSHAFRETVALCRGQATLRQAVVRAPIWSSSWFSALDQLHALRKPGNGNAVGGSLIQENGTRPTLQSTFRTRGQWSMPELVRASADVWVELAEAEDDASIATDYRTMASDLRQLAQLLDSPAGRT
ncbi:MAG: hypothetical protein JO021_04920 [Alphaproteobacteria bacterium]|nr:hypothetical protein [Alphaproteobacteria bacterium]